MDQQETDHITENISNLVRYTIVNVEVITELVQAEVISDAEKDEIVSCNFPVPEYYIL